MSQKKAVVLLSGGLDSSTTLAIAKKQGYQLYCLSFDYGQLHQRELHAAQKIAKFFGAKNHTMLTFNLRAWGGSALTNPRIKLPQKKHSVATIPITYVPARNTIFLSFALSYAETIKAQVIFIGVNALDYAGYPDCRPEFIRAFQHVAILGTKCGIEKKQKIKIKTPLLHWTKKKIVQQAQKLGVPLKFTWSCYRGTSKPCGTCESCLLRTKGFHEARIVDPLKYSLKEKTSV